MKRYGEQQERLSYLSASGKERKKAPGHWQIEFKFKIYSDIRCSYTIQSGKSTISLVEENIRERKKCDFAKFIRSTNGGTMVILNWPNRQELKVYLIFQNEKNPEASEYV